MSRAIGPQKRLPDWLDEWTEGTCGCGARVGIVHCMTGERHTVCAVSGWDTDKCPEASKRGLADG